MAEGPPTFSIPAAQDQLYDKASSTMDGMIAVYIITAIVGTVATVAIVYFMVKCFMRTGDTIDNIAKTNEQDPASSNLVISYQRSTGPKPPFAPEHRELPDGFESMERFLKPVRFSCEQLAAFTENYSTVLGSGAYGVVYKGQLSNGWLVAVKVLRDSAGVGDEDQFMAEVSSIGRTHHINLVRLYGFCFESAKRALVFEYMENGSLEILLFKELETPIEWETLHQIAIGTAKGIAYLHEDCHQRIVHYDIKAGNILLDGSLNPKIADFGLAKLCNRESSRITMTGFRGTPGYAAPELFEPYPITFKCDIYSFGMLLFEIVGRRKHFELKLPESRQWLPKWAWNMLEQNELPIMVSLLGVEEKDREKAEKVLKVAFLCIQYSPDERPLMSSVVKMLEGDMEIPSPKYPFKPMDHGEPSSGMASGTTSSFDAYSRRTV